MYDFLEGLSADIAVLLFRYKLPRGNLLQILSAGVIGIITRLLYWPWQIFFFGYNKLPAATLEFLVFASVIATFFWGIITLGLYKVLVKRRLVPFIPPDQT